jgi:hypothetical protein
VAFRRVHGEVEGGHIPVGRQTGEQPLGRFRVLRVPKGVPVVSPWCHSGATVVLQWCYSGVTVELQWCYSGVAVVLQWCYSGVKVSYHCMWPLAY